MRVIRNVWRLQNNFQQTSFAVSRISTNVQLLPTSPMNSNSVRWQSTGGFMKNIVGFLGIGPLAKSMTRIKGYGLYETITKNVDYDRFMTGMNMPDTFHTWFLVTELHVWMLMVRLMNEGKEGRLIRNGLVNALWDDVEQRSKQLGEMATSVRRQQIQILGQQFQAALFSYDEGIQSSDQVLAGALWRTFFHNREFNAEHLKILVEHVRQHIHQLDSLTKEDIIEKRFKWISPPV